MAALAHAKERGNGLLLLKGLGRGFFFFVFFFRGWVKLCRMDLRGLGCT